MTQTQLEIVRMTTEEAIEKLFPQIVIEQAKQVVAASDEGSKPIEQSR